MLTFDHEIMRFELDMVDKHHRLVFAAACAERTYQMYVLFHEMTGSGDVIYVRQTLDILWQSCTTGPAFGEELPFLKRSELLAPGDAVPPSNRSIAGPLAEDSIWTIDSACRVLQTSASKDAVSSAYFEYEAADYLAHSLEQSLSERSWMQSEILARPYVQEQLQCQKDDLQILKTLSPCDIPIEAANISSKARLQSFKLLNTARHLINMYKHVQTTKIKHDGNL